MPRASHDTTNTKTSPTVMPPAPPCSPGGCSTPHRHASWPVPTASASTLRGRQRQVQRWCEQALQAALSELPLKQNDHAMDATRYALHTYLSQTRAADAYLTSIQRRVELRQVRGRKLPAHD